MALSWFNTGLCHPLISTAEWLRPMKREGFRAMEHGDVYSHGGALHGLSLVHDATGGRVHPSFSWRNIPSPGGHSGTE